MINPLDIATKGYLKDSFSIATKGYLTIFVEVILERSRVLVKIPKRYLTFPRFKLSK